MADTAKFLTPLIEVLRKIRDEQILSQVEKRDLLATVNDALHQYIAPLLTAQRRYNVNANSRAARTHKRLIEQAMVGSPRMETTLESVSAESFDRMLRVGSVYAYIDGVENQMYVWSCVYRPKQLYIGDAWIEKLANGWQWLMPQLVPGFQYHGVMRPIDLPANSEEIPNPLEPDFDRWMVEVKEDGRNIMMVIYKSGKIALITRGGKLTYGSKAVLRNRTLYSKYDIDDETPGKANKVLYKLNGELIAGDATGPRPAEESVGAGVDKAGIFVAFDILYHYKHTKPVCGRSLRTRRAILEEVVMSYTGSEASGIVYDPMQSWREDTFIKVSQRLRSAEEIAEALKKDPEGLIYKKLSERNLGMVADPPTAREKASIERRKKSWLRFKKATTFTVQSRGGEYSTQEHLLDVPMALSMEVRNGDGFSYIGKVASLSDAAREYLYDNGLVDQRDGTFSLENTVYMEIAADMSKGVNEGTCMFRHPRIIRFRDPDEGFTLASVTELK